MSVLLLALCLSYSEDLALPDGNWVDLTHVFDENTIYWPTADGFHLEIVSKGHTDGGFYYEANNYKAAEHGGTHLDAPIHFAEGRQAADEVPIDRLIGPAVVLDVSAQCAKNSDYQVSTRDFQDWEKKHGKIEDGSIVLLRTGFYKHWPDRKKYMGTDERGPQAVAKLHFPGLHPDAAKWLVDNRKIKAIGLDTPSIDYGQSTKFGSHVFLFEQNIPAFENVANMGVLPTRGALVIALPMKIKAGSGGPLRIVALLPEK